MAVERTSIQEIVETRLDNFMRGSIKDELNGAIRVVAVIEYL